MEISKEWIEKTKAKGLIDDSDPPEIIESCYQIFGEDLGEKLPTEQLALLREI